MEAIIRVVKVNGVEVAGEGADGKSVILHRLGMDSSLAGLRGDEFLL